MPGKLRAFPGEENNAEYYLKGTHLEYFREEVDYEEMQKKEIEKELPSLKY